MTNAPRGSKNERRDAAREKAREERLRQQRRERRNKVTLQAAIGIVIVAIVAVVAVIIVNSVRPPGPGPKNMANGGITISGAQLAASRTTAPSAAATPTPQATVGGGKVLIQAYEDFGCPACQSFEQTYGTQIKALITSGAAVVQYHPVAILDSHFTDNSYSSRAANAGAAVANYSPDSYPAFHSLLYQSAVQPKEGGAGLTDERLIALVKQVKASNMAQITKAIKDQQFKAWVSARTAEFVDKTGSLSAVKIPTANRASTPTIVVNGQYWNSTDAPNFGSFVTSVGGAASTAPTATPTPTPTASAKASRGPSPTPSPSN
jgi:protein-disulfide isomerase